MASQLGARVSVIQQVNVRELRAEMVRQGMNQTALAGALGVAQQVLSSRLTGRTPFTLDELDRIAEVLHCDVAQFLSDDAA